MKLDEQIVRFLSAKLAWTPGWRPSANRQADRLSRRRRRYAKTLKALY